MNHLRTLLLLFAGGAAAMTASALVREAPGAKTYALRHIAIDTQLQPDAGYDFTATACGAVALTLGDGGVQAVDLGCTPCALSAGNKTALRPLVTAGVACLQNAP